MMVLRMRAIDSMKYQSAIFAILVASFMVGPATATEHQQGGEGEDPQTEFTLITHSDAQGGGYFTLEGDQQGNESRNPEIVVPPNEEITVTLRANDSMDMHNFRVEGEEGSEFVQQEGDEITYNFTSPADGTFRYWCEPHEAQGMEGTFRVAEEQEGDENETDAEDDQDDPFVEEDPGEGSPEDEDGETPAPGIIAVIGVFAFAALFYRRRR